MSDDLYRKEREAYRLMAGLRCTRETREHAVLPGGKAKHGRSTCIILCPFCGAETECFVWSFFGAGKTCECGAIHGGDMRTPGPPSEAEKEAKRVWRNLNRQRSHYRVKMALAAPEPERRPVVTWFERNRSA